MLDKRINHKINTILFGVEDGLFSHKPSLMKNQTESTVQSFRLPTLGLGVEYITQDI